MSYLLDTHTLLWLLEGKKSFSENVKNVLADNEVTKYISATSFWEIGIKISIGKLEINYPLQDLRNAVIEKGFVFLSVTESHGLGVTTLPFHHKDPFDRMLIAQAKAENLTIITKDPIIPKYDVPTLW